MPSIIHTLICALFFSASIMQLGAESRQNDLAPAANIVRRDPSDTIKVDGTYYVYYSKMERQAEIDRCKKLGIPCTYPEGYHADVWAASSTDEGKTWKEIGPMITRGKQGSWDSNSVFTPNILRLEGKYYLYFTAVGTGFTNRGCEDKNRTCIGLAVGDSPTGPFNKLPKPILESTRAPEQFDSFRIDDAALRVVDGKIWLYYKGRQWNNTPRHTKMGVAIADQPEGPYKRYNNGKPIQSGGHEVMVWEHSGKVFNFVSKTAGQKSPHIRRTSDGLSNDGPEAMAGPCAALQAPGLYRPELTGDPIPNSKQRWGLHMKRGPQRISLERFTIDMAPYLPKKK